MIEPKTVVAVSIITAELARSSEPSAETLLSGALSRAMARELDRALVDLDNDGTGGAPQSITYDAPKHPSSGAALADIDTDLTTLLDALIDDGHSTLEHVALILHPKLAARLGVMRGDGGGFGFPNVGPKGGTIVNVPVLTSAAAPPDAIIAVDGSQLLVVDPADVSFSVATAATVQLTDDRQAAANAERVSLWQRNLVGLKAQRRIGWRLARPEAAQVLTDLSL